MKAVYLLIHHGTSRFPVMAHLSISALKRLYPQCTVTLVTDQVTPPYLKEQYPELVEQIQEWVTVSSDIPNLAARSFEIKSRLRLLVDGDFIYLDCDTLPIRAFAEVFDQSWDIALVADRNHHCPIEPVYPFWKQDQLTRMGWHYPQLRYFNAGLGFYRDNSQMRQFAQDWNNRWHEAYQKTGDHDDQIPLAVTLCESPQICLLELPVAYNAMVSVSPRHAREAKIYHFFAGNVATMGPVLFEYLIQHYQQHRQIDWATIDYCVQMNHPWMPPYWSRQLWQSGNYTKAIQVWLQNRFRGKKRSSSKV